MSYNNFSLHSRDYFFCAASVAACHTPSAAWYMYTYTPLLLSSEFFHYHLSSPFYFHLISYLHFLHPHLPFPFSRSPPIPLLALSIFRHAVPFYCPNGTFHNFLWQITLKKVICLSKKIRKLTKAKIISNETLWWATSFATEILLLISIHHVLWNSPLSEEKFLYHHLSTSYFKLFMH